LGFIVFFIELARNIAPKISDERGLQLRERSPQQQRIHARMLVRLQNRFVEQRLGLPWPRSSAKQPVFRARIVKLFLPRKWLVKILDLARALAPLRLVGSKLHGIGTTDAHKQTRMKAKCGNNSDFYL